MSSLFIKNVCTEQWRLEELDAIIGSIEDEIAIAIQEKQIKTEYDYVNIVLRIAGKAIVCMREIICLSAYGYPDGALSLARNIFEHFIIIAFLQNHRYCDDFSEYIENYYMDYDIQRYRALIYEYRHCTQDAIQLKTLTEELDKLMQATHHAAKNGMYWWTGHSNFAQLVESVISSVSEEDDLKGFLRNLHLAYKRACVSVHSNCMGNTLRLGIDPDFTGIDTSPTQNGHSLPLWFSTTAFIYIVGITYETLDLEYQDCNSKLNELAIFFYKKGA